jgi:hypothetical protein
MFHKLLYFFMIPKNYNVVYFIEVFAYKVEWHEYLIQSVNIPSFSL